MRRSDSLSAAQARRIAIAAQRLDRRGELSGSDTGSRVGLSAGLASHAADRRDLRRVLRSIGLLQIDSVNVLARAHYLPLFARLGPYPTELLDGAVWSERLCDRMLFETWAHVASLVPVDLEPYLRWRKQRASVSWVADRAGIAGEITAVIAERGPMSAGQIEKALALPGPGRPGWWEWSQTKSACEKLFADGVVGTAYRRGFERHYDLMERIIPSRIRALPTPSEQDAQRHLVELAAQHHGVGTAKDLADYYRLPFSGVASALAELAEAGVVQRVSVEGWSEPGYLHGSAKVPRTVHGQALLCPFDPLIFERARTERLFGFRYRIEIYTPSAKRQYGYYVFPLLLGERLGGRFDLKADRADGVLRVQAAWVEPGPGLGSGSSSGSGSGRGVRRPAEHRPDPGEVAQAAAVELGRMAQWLGLSDIAVAERGNLAPQLASAVGRS